MTLLLLVHIYNCPTAGIFIYSVVLIRHFFPSKNPQHLIQCPILVIRIDVSMMMTRSTIDGRWIYPCTTSSATGKKCEITLNDILCDPEI